MKVFDVTKSNYPVEIIMIYFVTIPIIYLDYMPRLYAVQQKGYLVNSKKNVFPRFG